MGGDRFSENMVDYAFRLLKRHRFQPRTVLDLCCGTGTAAILMCEAGYDVAGLDGSAYMLRMARQKTAYKKLPIRFIHQQLPDFHIKNGRKTRTFDLITCFYDSLNYLLTEKDLKRCFRAVHDHLNPGGLFICDMNTFHAFRHVWSKTHAGCHEEVAWIFESETDEKNRQAVLTATFFIKKKRHWERFSEVHRERAYNNTTIRRLLRQSKLDAIGLYKCFRFRKPDLKTNRIAVVAKKAD